VIHWRWEDSRHASRDIVTDAGFFAADRFSKACCGKAVELANAAAAWMNAREVAQRREELSMLTWPEEL
jgi:hypothetical protein